MQNNTKNRPVILLFVTIVLLLAFNFIPSGEMLWGIELKKVDILMDIREDVKINEVPESSDKELWNEDDDFFKDDPPLEPDSLKQQK